MDPSLSSSPNQGKEEIFPWLETIPQEILEKIVEQSENIRNVRQVSKSLRYNLGDPLGNLAPLLQSIGTNQNLFSIVGQYLDSEDIKNLRRVSTGLEKMSYKKWIDNIFKNNREMFKLQTNVNGYSKGIRRSDVKISELLFRLKDEKFFDLLNYVIKNHKFKIENYIYLGIKEGISGLTQLIEKNNLYRKQLLSPDNEQNLLFFAIFNLINETDPNKREKLLKVIVELFEFGFNPAYREISFKKELSANAYDLLGKENAEKLFGPESNYSQESYALEKSTLDSLFDFPKNRLSVKKIRMF